MVERVIDSGPFGKQLGRVVLRVLNGAAIGTLLGALLGFALGGISAAMVGVSNAGGFNPSSAAICLICAIYGIFPGVPAGALIGATLALRNDRWRSMAAVGLGIAAGGTYMWLLKDNLARILEIRIAIVTSGLVGGALMAWIMRGIRRRWNWWTRWDA